MEPALHTSERAEADLTLRVVRAAAEAVIAHADELTALDQAIGDGDHGINMKRGLEAVLADLPQLAGQASRRDAEGYRHEARDEGRRRLRPALRHAGDGTREAHAARLPRAATWRQPSLPRSRPSRREASPSLAQKTMLDVLAPVQAKLAEGADLRAIKAEALRAAEATRPIQALRGRASFLGERSIGHVDPGARSAALFVAAICDTLEG